MLYVVDTNVLIDAWTKWYAPEVIPPFWINVENLAETGRLTIPEPVLWELEEQDDDLYRWCKMRESVLVTPSSAEIQSRVQMIANKYPNLCGRAPQSKNHADPFVIALASYFSCTLVTHEQATGNLQGPRIPDVCKAEGLRAIQLYRLIQEQHWRFGQTGASS